MRMHTDAVDSERENIGAKPSRVHVVEIGGAPAQRHVARMAYIRTHRIKRNGKIYEYRRLVKSVRIPGVGPRQIDLGRAPDDYGSPAMLLNEDTMAKNQEALAAGKHVTEADPTGKENASDKEAGNEGKDEGGSTPS